MITKLRSKLKKNVYYNLLYDVGQIKMKTTYLFLKKDKFYLEIFLQISFL